MMSAARRTAAVGLSLLVLGLLSPALAEEKEEKVEEVSLPSTLVTEGATPATEVEGTFTISRSPS
jgi:hypothetical protein